MSSPRAETAFDSFWHVLLYFKMYPLAPLAVHHFHPPSLCEPHWQRPCSLTPLLIQLYLCIAVCCYSCILFFPSPVVVFPSYPPHPAYRLCFVVLCSCSYLYYLCHFFYDPSDATVVRPHFNNIYVVCPHAVPMLPSSPSNCWTTKLLDFVHPFSVFSFVFSWATTLKIRQLGGPRANPSNAFLWLKSCNIICELF